MAVMDFYKLLASEKKEVFEELSRIVGLPSFAIEKDWWAVQTLRLIFGTEVGEHLLFKGGTSLSKGWGLIDRFSEDIDLALDRKFLGFSGDLISKSQVRKLRTKAHQYLTGEFLNLLKEAFAINGFGKIAFELEELQTADQDPISIMIYYPSETVHSTYLPPRVKVEVGGRSMNEPFTMKSIVSIVGVQFSDRKFADEPVEVPCVNPERTYLEKLFLLHEEFQKETEKIRVERLSRHLYDIERISRTEFAQKALKDKALYESIVQHRERFNAMRGIDYNLHYPPYLNPIPPKGLLSEWKKDYKRMQKEMIYGESLDFDELIEVIKKISKQFNALA